MDATIRRIQAQLPSVIVSGLSLYFAVVFGIGGVKTLLLLHDGTTDYVAAALTQAIGYAFGPWFAHLTAVSAALGATQIAVCGYFILAVTERSSAATNGEGQREHGALDLALHCAVALTLLQALPAYVAGETAVVRMHLAHVMLICVAVGTSMFEREYKARRARRAAQLEAALYYQSQQDRPLSGRTLPPP
jgi:hypothetical protein